MAHDDQSAQCTVYVWYLSYKAMAMGVVSSIPGLSSYGNAPIGHASIKISDGLGQYEYLSWWPGHFPSRTSSKGRYVASKSSVGDMSSFDKDTDHEGHSPDYKCRITAGLDFNAMCVFARDVKLGTRSVVPGGKLNIGGPDNTAYDLRQQNCSHAVAYCLAAGNPPMSVPLTGTFTNTWTPNHVYEYCHKLVGALNGATAGSATEKTGGAWG